MPKSVESIPLGPKLLHHITLSFRIDFPDDAIILYIAEFVSNSFLDYVISCVVARHTMWASDFITELFSNSFTGYVIYLYIIELVSNCPEGLRHTN